MTWTDFSRGGHRALSAEIQNELQALAQRHGLTISTVGGQYSGDGLTIKVECKPAAGDNAAAVAEKAMNELSCTGRQFGLGPEHYGRVFRSQRGLFRFTGCNPNRPKYPISGTCVSTGRGFKFPAYVAESIKTAAPVVQQPTQQAPTQSQTIGSSDIGNLRDVFAAAGASF